MSNINLNKWHLNRRHMLRGMGVAMALPLLDCMLPLTAAEKKANSIPKRCAFFYIPNGVNTIDWQIEQEGKDYTFSKTLKCLEKHRSNITPISGLYHPNAIGKHHGGYKNWLTGGKLGAADRNSISVDQLIAQNTSKQTRFSSLIMANKGGSLSFNADGIHLPAQYKPKVIFDELFTEPKGGISQQRRRLNRKASIIDANLDEAKALEKKIGKEDKDRLDQYLTSVREVEVRTQRADSWLDVPRPKISPEDEKRTNKDPNQKTQVGEYFRTMYDLIILAFQTDMTRVATFSTGLEGQGLPIPEIGISLTRHSLSHHNGNKDHMKQLTDSDIFNLQQYCYFLDRLASIREGDGTLLDSTLSMYGSNMSYGHSHGMTNIPLVLAGGSRMGIKHGRHLDLHREVSDFKGYQLDDPGKHYHICHNPVNKKSVMSNLLLNIAQKMDVEIETFADSNSRQEV